MGSTVATGVSTAAQRGDSIKIGKKRQQCGTGGAAKSHSRAMRREKGAVNGSRGAARGASYNH